MSQYILNKSAMGMVNLS